MLYYLDTNAVYNLKNIKESVINCSFYSPLTLIEIIAGISNNQDNFLKRQAVLKNLINSQVKIENAFPEEIILSSFDYFKKYEFKENRIDSLFSVIEDIISAISYSDFLQKTLFNNLEFDFEYFRLLDISYTKGFIDTTAEGNKIITSALKDSCNSAKLKLSNKTYDLSSREAIANFLDQPYVNSSITKLALAKFAIQCIKEENNVITENLIYETYNGSIDIYVDAFSEFTKQKMLQASNPARNDFQDLTHLLYLSNRDNIKIISSDKLFIKYVPNKTVKLEDIKV